MKDFFKKLRREMMGNPYQDRFLSELEDHADDLINDQSGNKIPPNPDFMEKHFGEPKQVKKDFVSITRPWHRWFVAGEALMYGLLIPPLFYLLRPLSVLVKSLFTDLFLPGIYFLILLSVPIIWFFIYYFIIKRWQALQPLTDFPQIIWMLLVFLPTASLAFLLYSSDEFLPYSSFFVFSAFAFNFVIAFFAYLFIHLKNKKQKNKLKKIHPPKSALPLFFRKLLIGYVVLFCISRFIFFKFLPYLPYLEPSSFYSFLGNFLKLFSPLYFVEYFTLFGLSGFIGAGIYFPWILGCVLVFLILQSLVSMLYYRSWFWPRGLLILYILSLLFIPVNFFEKKIDFKVPFYPVSAELEKSQMWPFYALTKYLNQDEGKLFRYEVKTDGGLFGLWQNTGKRFYFSPEEWVYQKVDSIMKKESTDINYAGSYISVWPKALTCQRDEMDEVQSDQTTYCPQVLFKGTIILPHRDLAYDVQDLALSEDQNWLLMVLGTGAYSPHEVYLLDLRAVREG